MLGFQTFHARYTIKGTLTWIELVHVIRKGQIRQLANDSSAVQFKTLAG